MTARPDIDESTGGTQRAPELVPRLPTRAVAALAIASALTPLGSTMIAVALPTIARDLDVPRGALTQWLANGYLIVAMACQSPAGKLGDRVGHRATLAAGQALFALGTVGAAFARGPVALVVARMVMALGGATIVPSAMALVRSALPSSQHARAFGAFGSLMALAAALGPLVGGELTARLGWPAIFAVNAPIVALTAALAAGTLPAGAPRRARAPRFDTVGAVLLGAALTTVVWALQHRTAAGAAAGALGALGLAAFWRWERRAPDPVVDPSLFRDRGFAAACAVIALQNLTMYALLFDLPQFFASVRGVGPARSGRVLLAMMLATIVCSPVGARLGARIGTRATVLAGSLVALAGVAMLHDVASLRAPGDAVLPLVALGAGLGFSTAPSQAAALGVVDRARSGMASGVVSTARYFGGVVGIAALGAALGGNASDLAGHRRAVAVFLAASALACVASLWLPRRPPGDRETVPPPEPPPARG